MIKTANKKVRKAISFTIAFALLLCGAPVVYADSNIQIVNKTSYFQNLDTKVFQDYLTGVKQEWGWIWQGKYRIYITDHLPTSIANSLTSASEHAPSGAIYIGVSEILASGYGIYYAITHELAETAIDENLDFYNQGQLVEIADPVVNQVSSLDGQKVASYVLPSYYGWIQF